MPLPIGDRFGSCEILGLIGKGGMGEVYRARDTNLKRDVALKVLPVGVAEDPERLRRFQREAEILASLNHPGIAAIYGLAENALVMELVEGETLPCPVPIGTAIVYAQQIVNAVEYAHDRGVIHRDLKPANIKVTAEGVVKILDFGLAKALDERAPAATNPAYSPTLSMGATAAGVILGTAAYMSPEQAVGKSADRRADIFSFGAGGPPGPATANEPAENGYFHVFPWFLPDGRHFLCSSESLQKTDRRIRVGSLDDPGKPGKVVGEATSAVYAQGNLLYLRERALMAQPFDLNRLERKGNFVSLLTSMSPSSVVRFTSSAGGYWYISRRRTYSPDWSGRTGRGKLCRVWASPTAGFTSLPLRRMASMSP